MLHPSYSELMDVVNSQGNQEDPIVKSRYSIVLGTAKRARQLVENGYMDSDNHQIKPLSVAVEELRCGKVRILSSEEAEQLAAKAQQEEEEALVSESGELESAEEIAEEEPEAEQPEE